MKQRLVIALLAALCFGAGFGARMWTEDDGPAVPPPSAVLGSEFATTGSAKAEARNRSQSRGASHGEVNRNRLAGDIQRLRPQIDAYCKRLEEIDREFDRDVVALLTAEQREKFAARQKRLAERRAKDEARDADTAPLTDEQLFQLQQRPLWNVLWSVSIDSRFDRLNKELKLDDQQAVRVKALYRERREKFIALVDTVPPPTITLSQLATQAQKIGGDPAKK